MSSYTPSDSDTYKDPQRSQTLQIYEVRVETVPLDLPILEVKAEHLKFVGFYVNLADAKQKWEQLWQGASEELEEHLLLPATEEEPFSWGFYQEVDGKVLRTKGSVFRQDHTKENSNMLLLGYLIVQRKLPIVVHMDREFKYFAVFGRPDDDEDGDKVNTRSDRGGESEIAKPSVRAWELRFSKRPVYVGGMHFYEELADWMYAASLDDARWQVLEIFDKIVAENKWEVLAIAGGGSGSASMMWLMEDEAWGRRAFGYIHDAANPVTGEETSLSRRVESESRA